MSSELRRAYALTLRSPLGVEYVLPDLAKVCHALERAPSAPDLWVQGRFAGWQDVWLHILNQTHLTEEEAIVLKQGKGRAILRPDDFPRLA